ncbi:MAG: hypothetical protein ACYSWU_07270, partial [Planctomycetota bacterium]
MCGNIACIAAVLLGIDAGWQPLPDGGMLYIIQIEPQLLETLSSGEPVQSDVPPYVKDVRAYRIMVGTGELPRQLPPEPIESPGGGRVSHPRIPPTAPADAATDRPPTDPFIPPPASPSNWPDPSAGLPPLRQPGAESPGAPKMIEPARDSKRIDAQTAGYIERPSAEPQDKSKSPSDQGTAQEEPP